jgi:hypothetical protein
MSSRQAVISARSNGSSDRCEARANWRREVTSSPHSSALIGRSAGGGKTSAHRELAPALDYVVALIAHLGEPPGNVLEAYLGTRMELHGGRVGRRSHELSSPLSRRRDHKRLVRAQAMEHRDAPAHGLDGGRHRLAGKYLPPRKDLATASAQEGLDVTCDLLGLITPCSDGQDRSAEVTNERRQQERPDRIGHGDRGARVEQSTHALVGEKI